MYFITAFGLLMMCLSIIMIVRPNYWADGIVSFSKKPYFHWFEVLTRLFAGVVFVHYSALTLSPRLTLCIGYVLILVALGLTITGPMKHKQFAIWSARQFKHTFRAAGFCSFLFGGFLIYISSIGVWLR